MLKKLAAAVIAASTAIIPFSADTVNVLNVYAEETSGSVLLPEWMPKDYESALEFRNTYGTTHIEDGMICVVHESGNPQMSPHFEVNGKYENQDESFVCGDTFDRYPGADDSPYIMASLYKPTKSGTLTISYKNDMEQTDYSFETDAEMNITETDIYGLLPDCEKEYEAYVKENGALSVRDNVVVFCMDSNAGTPLIWQEKSDNYSENFERIAFLFCNTETAEPVDGGEIHQIAAYQAVRDGYAKIEWEYLPSMTWELDPPFSEEDMQQSLTADCAVINDARNVLLSGDMRVTLADFDTGELLKLPEGAMPTIWTDISKTTPDGEVFLNMQPCGFRQNPATVRLGDFFDGYNFSFGLSGNDLPEGYSLPDTEDEKAGYHNGTILPDGYMTVKTYDNNSADVVFRLNKKQDIPEKDTIRFKLINADNGKTLNLGDYGYPFGINAAINYYIEDQALPYFISKDFTVETNPYSLDLSSEVASGLKIDKISRFDVSLNTVVSSCDIRTDDIQKTVYENNSMDVIVPIRFIPTGDVNFDGKFSISDLVSFQKWLLGAPDTTLADWKAADFCNDGRLDVFDLILMRQELIYYNTRAFIWPEELVRYSTPLIVREDDLKLYLGPNESYDCIASVPAGTRLRELGYMRNEDKWLYTEYNGQKGWIKTVKEDGVSPTIYYEAAADKPVIYLYPEKETDVHVELELTGAELSTTYPKYNNGWDVTASPDGSLLNKADGTHHKYLFWDAVNCRTRYDLSKGFCVAGSDTESFLKEKLTYMGLTEEEMNEFIVYWLPRMEHNAYNLISFQGAAYTDSARLDITPSPDSMLRVFMAYVPLEEAVDIQPQQLETFERKGFTVVEWGGSEIKA